MHCQYSGTVLAALVPQAVLFSGTPRCTTLPKHCPDCLRSAVMPHRPAESHNSPASAVNRLPDDTVPFSVPESPHMALPASGRIHILPPAEPERLPAMPQQHIPADQQQN